MNKIKESNDQKLRHSADYPDAPSSQPNLNQERSRCWLQRFVRRLFHGQIYLHWILVWIFVCGMVTSIFATQFPSLWIQIKSNIFLTCSVYVLPGLILWWNRR